MTSQNKKTKRLIVELPIELHQIIKLTAIQRNLTMKEMIEEMIKENFIEKK